MERDITKLITQMTLEEKASLCSGKDMWQTKAIERLGIPCCNWAVPVDSRDITNTTILTAGNPDH